MKNILVPTDFSKYGKIAESTAISIAEKAKANLDFLHLMDIPKYLSQSATAKPELPEELKIAIGAAHQYMNDLNHNATQKGLTVKTFISENASFDVIKNHIVQHNIDLIIMGSHGASGFKACPAVHSSLQSARRPGPGRFSIRSPWHGGAAPSLLPMAAATRPTKHLCAGLA